MVSRRNIEIPGPTVSTSTDLGASSAMKVRETVENPASLQSAHMVVQQDKMSCGSRDVKWSYIWRMKPASRSSMSSSRNSTVSCFAMDRTIVQEGTSWDGRVAKGGLGNIKKKNK